MSNATVQLTARNSSQSPARAESTSTATPSHTLRSEKITAEHLERSAIVYVRQSTRQQVLEHRESTARQYALVDRAVALGWPAVAVEVIDEDQGRSGSSAEGRSGFQRLLAEVSSDRVGIILSTPVRIAGDTAKWIFARKFREDQPRAARSTRTTSAAC